jgi:hypothetical protein
VITIFIFKSDLSMESALNKQQEFPLDNGLIFSSRFESGNLAKVQPKDNNTVC